MLVYPVLPRKYAAALFADNVVRNLNSIETIRKSVDLNSIQKKVVWPTSGKRVDWEVFANIRNQFDLLMEKQDKNKVGGNFSQFDKSAYRIVRKTLDDLSPAYASKNEFWAFINIVIIPDVVAFRWRKMGKMSYEINSERVFSNTRNYAGSLWWRVFFFYDKYTLSNSWHIIDSMQEDDFVQILERTNLRGYPDMALAYGRWVSRLRNDSSLSSEQASTIIRRASVELRILATSYEFIMLYTDSSLETLVNKVFDRMQKEVV